MSDNDQKNSVSQEYESPKGTTRREFIIQVTLAGAAFTIVPWIGEDDFKRPDAINQYKQQVTELFKINLLINGEQKSVSLDPRTTLLDMLREKLSLMGTKKGCDRGQCGACTVLVNGKRINSCLRLAVSCDNTEITTIEGLAHGDELHPVQSAFIKHDAFQCGYCTPGQICSAVGLINEGQAKNAADIRELMSGNICRCGAYQHILDAILEVYQPAKTS